MAKKYTARAEGLVAIRLDVTAADRDRIRIAAAQAGQPMSEYVRGVVLRDVEKKSKKNS